MLLNEANRPTAFVESRQATGTVPPLAMPEIASCWPPLDSVTIVRGSRVLVTVLLEVAQAHARDPWEAALWFSRGGEWSESGLTPTGKDCAPSSLQPESGSTRKLYFSASVDIQSRLTFTVKCRNAPSGPWQWIRDLRGLGDGLVIYNPGHGPGSSPDLSGLVPGLASRWRVTPVLSQSPKTAVWTLEADVDAADGEESTYADDVPVGVPFGGYLRWFATTRMWKPWVVPRHGRRHFEIDSQAVMVCFLGPQGQHLVLLAVSGINDVTTMLVSRPDGGVSAQARSDGATSQTASVVVAVGDDYWSTVAAAMYQARDMVMKSKHVDTDLAREAAALGRHEVRPEWWENWYDGLGYCTWNALGQRLTDEKIFAALDKLAEQNVNVSTLIIDDNWQSIDLEANGNYQQGWQQFEAEPHAFPRGLKETVRTVRQKHPSLRHVAVWHALLGYWGGIDAKGTLARDYETIEVIRDEHERDRLPLGGPMRVVAKQDVARFYDNFYSFLSSCGIDGVKTDAQFMMDTWTSAIPRRELMREYVDAWTVAALRYFGGRAISCMSHVPQLTFYSLLPNNRPAFLYRNSNDFVPEDPTSHPWHLWVNSHNAVLAQHLNVVPDWDMFQTVHEYSAYHAAARCVSGGPVYITDVPGEHDIDLIRQMTGTTVLGNTVIFRTSSVGKTVDPYAGYHDRLLLKVGSHHGSAAAGTPILGVFNISKEPLGEIIPLASFPGIVPSSSYVVRSHVSGLVSAPLQANSASSLLTHHLGVRDYDILTAFPLAQFEGKVFGDVQVANLGLLGKMAGAAAIVSSSATSVSRGRLLLDTRLKAIGTVGVYVSTLPDMTIEDNFIATLLGETIPPRTVSVSKVDNHVLEIDVEKAWKEMNLHGRMSNEVQLKIYLNV